MSTMQRIIPIFLSFALLLVFVKAIRGNPVADDDVLAYSVFNYGDGTMLKLFDAKNGEHKTLYQTDDRIWFEFSADGRIALTTGTGWPWENNSEFFMLDTTESDQRLVNLSQELDITGYPLGWSRDGRKLAFASVRDDGEQQAIYVWDGTTVTDITPQNTPGSPQSFDIAWSHDGRLAFTVWFGASNRDPRSEIYIWDGESTFNLSQNEEAEDRQPVWNTKGEIAFGSVQDHEQILLVWDGTSYAKGVPDAESFIRVAPQLEIFSPFSIWVDDNLLAFPAFTPLDFNIQIYTWDTETLSNVSQNPLEDNYAPQWSQDGYWAFVTNERRLYVRDARNNTVFESFGWYTPAWSSGGSLIFCSRNGRSGWNLSRWDHASASTIVQADVIYAQWRSGQSTVCSDG